MKEVHHCTFIAMLRKYLSLFSYLSSSQKLFSLSPTKCFFSSKNTRDRRRQVHISQKNMKKQFYSSLLNFCVPWRWNSINLLFLTSFRMSVTCDGSPLHDIFPFQFIDSPEYMSCQNSSDDLYQVNKTFQICRYFYISKPCEKEEGKKASKMHRYNSSSVNCRPCLCYYNFSLHSRVQSCKD